MLNVIKPVTVTESMVISTNVAEDDGPEWSASTTYAAGDRVILSANHRVYESVQAGNLNHDPATDDGTWWLDVSATNRWRAFDQRLSAPVENNGTITYLIEPGSLVRGIGLVGVSATEATVRVRDSSGTVLIFQTQNLADYSELIDAITMATVAPKFQNTAVFEDIICTAGNRIEVVIGDGTGSVKVSEIVLGDILKIGEPLYGAEVGIDDFSVYDTDQFGNVDIVERGYRDIVEFPVIVRNSNIARLKSEMTEIRARMAFFYIDTDGTDYGTKIYGRYESLRQIISGPTISDMTIRILGATYGN